MNKIIFNVSIISLFLIIIFNPFSNTLAQNRKRPPVNDDNNSKTFVPLTQPQSKQIPIELKQGLVNTGIHLLTGQSIMIKADGILYWYGKKYHQNWHTSPDGQKNCGVPMPASKLPCWSLIGSWGKDSAAFFVGSNFSGAPDHDCDLYLGVNDNNYVDNDGGWTATVYWNGMQPKTNDCIYNDRPHFGDVVIWWNGDRIMHSGYVSVVSDDGCSVLQTKSWVQHKHSQSDPGEELIANPDSPIFQEHFGKNVWWNVYNPATINDRAIKHKQILNPPQGETNLGTVIILDFLPTNGVPNCHGYTFTAGYLTTPAIIGYQLVDMIPHINNNAQHADQSIAVKYILHDDLYKQIHALGTNKVLHYNQRYDIENLKNIGN